MHRILIVDDESLLLQGLSRALTTNDNEVITASSGEAALTEISDTPCHLCFLDIFLPDINGVDVLKRIRSISPKTKVIMMTAGDINRSIKESIEDHAYLYVPKPFDLLQMRMLAKRLLEIND